MNDLFIPYELAVIAKEKGFRERCIRYYNYSGIIEVNKADEFQNGHNYNDCNYRFSAPLYQQLVDWFKKVHKITIEPRTKTDLNDWSKFETKYIVLNWDGLTPFINEFADLNKAIEESFKLI